MEDFIVPEADQFSTQANIHHQVRDSLKEIVSSFDVHHNTIFTLLNSSQTEHYGSWWQTLKTYLLNQADLHDQLGKNLLTAGGNYHTTDQNVAKSFQGTDTSPVS